MFLRKDSIFWSIRPYHIIENEMGISFAVKMFYQFSEKFSAPQNYSFFNFMLWCFLHFRIKTNVTFYKNIFLSLKLNCELSFVCKCATFGII